MFFEVLMGEGLHRLCAWGFVPQVSSFYGIVITMYFGDHAPPHFHARYGEEGAKIEIAGGEVLAGSLSRRALRLVVKVAEVEPLEGLRIRATFSDGAIKEIDLGGLFEQSGIFGPIRRDRRVAAVRVNEETGAVEWPGEVDLDPEVLYGRFEPASGARVRRRTVREPVATG